MEYKRNKWNCEEGGRGECFQRRKVRVACLDGGENEREWRGIICGVNGINAGLQVMERARGGHPVERCVGQ